MSWTGSLRSRWRSLFGSDRATQELDREIQFHLDQQIAQNLALGMSGAEARREALRTFGNPTAVKEAARETWG